MDVEELGVSENARFSWRFSYKIDGGTRKVVCFFKRYSSFVFTQWVVDIYCVFQDVLCNLSSK